MQTSHQPYSVSVKKQLAKESEKRERGSSGGSSSKMESSNGSSSNDAIIETLTSRGWCFGDLEQVKVTILLHSALHVDSSIDSIESELSNMDLCSFGGKSLPDRPLLMKSSYLQGPKVLQVIPFTVSSLVFPRRLLDIMFRGSGLRTHTHTLGQTFSSV